MAEAAANQPAVALNRGTSLLACMGYGYMFVFMFGVVGLKWLTGEMNQMYWALSWPMVAMHLALMAVPGALIGGAYHAADRMFAGHTNLRRVLHRAAAGMIVMLAVVMLAHRAAFRARLLWAVDWLDDYATWFALAAGPLLILTPRLARVAGRTLRITARVMAPLPVVLLAYFYSIPQYAVEYQDPPAAKPAPDNPAPVLLIVMDALDHERIFGTKGGLSRLPNITRLASTGTVFGSPKTAGIYTHESMPRILYQRRDVRQLDDLGYVAAIDGTDVAGDSLPTFYDLVDRESDTRVMIGFHLDYTRMVGGRVDWLRTRSDRYAHPDESVARWLRSHFFLFAEPSRPMFLRQLAVVDEFYEDRWYDVCMDVHESCRTAIEAYGPSLVGVFHMVPPHPPFIFGPDGRVPGRTIDSPEEEDEAYLLNLQFADGLLGEYFSALDHQGLWDNATIILTGDHGYIWGPENRSPPIVIKLPGQRARVDNATELMTCDIVRWLHKQPEFTRVRPVSARVPEQSNDN